MFNHVQLSHLSNSIDYPRNLAGSKYQIGILSFECWGRLIRIYITGKRGVKSSIHFIGKFKYKLLCKCPIKKWIRIFSTLFDGDPTRASLYCFTLLNQTEPHIQAERNKSQQRKKWQEPATLLGLQQWKKFQKINILFSFFRHNTLARLIRDAWYNNWSRSLWVYIPQSDFTPQPKSRKEPKSWRKKNEIPNLTQNTL